MRKGSKHIGASLAGLAVLVAVLLSGCMPTATTGTTAEGAEGSATSGLGALLPFILIIAVMYFLMIRPQQKKTKQQTEMRNSLKPGDYVTTIGGFRGRVVKIKAGDTSQDDVITIAVGSDKAKLDIMRWGISKIDQSAPPKETKSTTKKSAKEREAELEEQIEEQGKRKPKKLTKPAKEAEAEAADEPEAAEEAPEEE